MLQRGTRPLEGGWAVESVVVIVVKRMGSRHCFFLEVAGGCQTGRTDLQATTVHPFKIIKHDARAKASPGQGGRDVKLPWVRGRASGSSSSTFAPARPRGRRGRGRRGGRVSAARRGVSLFFFSLLLYTALALGRYSAMVMSVLP